MKTSEEFLLSETDNYFVGRYFGAILASDIVGPLQAQLVF